MGLVPGLVYAGKLYARHWALMSHRLEVCHRGAAGKLPSQGLRSRGERGVIRCVNEGMKRQTELQSQDVEELRYEPTLV